MPIVMTEEAGEDLTLTMGVPDCSLADGRPGYRFSVGLLTRKPDLALALWTQLGLLPIERRLFPADEIVFAPTEWAAGTAHAAGVVAAARLLGRNDLLVIRTANPPAEGEMSHLRASLGNFTGPIVIMGLEDMLETLEEPAARRLLSGLEACDRGNGLPA